MLRCWLALILTVVSTTAWAQPASEPGQAAEPQLAAAAAATTQRAQDTVVAAGKYRDQLVAQRDGLRQRLNEQLVAIDRLKRGPRGWRTKAQLEERLSEANETQKELELADARVDAAERQLLAGRAALARAIDAELRAGVTGPRERWLRDRLAALTPQRAARRIVLPDTKVDPRLDPEELDEQVAAIKQVETELELQIRGLEERATELQRSHDLRQQHARTLELDQRDDNSSRRTAQQSSGGRAIPDSAAPPTISGGSSDSSGGSGGSGGSSSGGGAGSFENDAHIVLPEVVDSSVLDGIRTAQTSGDRAQRAAAVRKARDAVTAKLKDLRDKRAAIQGLAKQRRPQ